MRTDGLNNTRRQHLRRAIATLPAEYKSYFRKGHMDVANNRLWSAGKGYALVLKESCPWYVELQAYDGNSDVLWTL